MSYKTIVVQLDRGARCARRIELAIRLAAAHGSRLVGIAATGSPDAVVSVNRAVPDNVECVVLSADTLRDEAAALARAFERQCAAAGVASCEGRVVDAGEVEALIRNGRCSDLVVIGQTDPRAGVEGVPADLPEQALLHSGAPVLIVPWAGEFREPARRALVAWKGSREAARALRDALPMLRRAEHVKLLELGEDGAAPAQGGDDVEAAGRWLASHGVAADTRFEVSTIDVPEMLLSRAADFSADLIVMGGYGHARMREWALGGATRHLLAHMTAPTLMAH
ncbi:MAG TPA: universal stress protein [Caldimonas sp.]|nr:universal stress protein [Caldimonas sp.]